MKIKYALIAGLLLAAGAVSGGANAQVASTTGTNQNTSGSQASNLGNALTNNFTSPSDQTLHEKISGFTGSNTAVGLGSFSSSFSSDYCGGVAQGAGSVPFITIAGGKPVLGEPGIPCQVTRTAVHTMEFSATYGNAARTAMAVAEERHKELLDLRAKVQNPKSGEDAITSAAAAIDAQDAFNESMTTAKRYADQSDNLAHAAVNMLCNVSDDIRKAYRDANINCPLTDAEKKAAEQQTASK